MNKKYRRKPQQQRGHPHNDIFQRIYRNPAFVPELLKVSLTDEEIQHLDLSAIKVEESTSTSVGGKKRIADLIISVPLKGGKGELPVTIWIVYEHKSFPDEDVILQIMEYYVDLCREKRGVVIPIVLLCCQDASFAPQHDYLNWVFKGGKIPTAVQQLRHLLPNFSCKFINLRELPLEHIWERAKSTGVVLYAKCNFWNATKAHVVEIIDKSRKIPIEHWGNVMTSITDYYTHTDKRFGREEFDRIERENWPNLREEDRLMPRIEFSLDKAEKRGLQQGIEQGIEQGIAQKQRDVVERMLARGSSDAEMCDLLQLTRKELAAVKRELKS